MATGQLSGVVRHLRNTSSVVVCDGLSDAHLLDQFVDRRDETAFRTLVRRHGPMVLGVCRRVLKKLHDAEDAFQATFLILARQAASIKRRDSVASWLHSTALRAALLTHKAPWRRLEKQMTIMPDVEAAEAADLWTELRPVLDQELQRLPEKYRAAIVLCDLEGKTRQEAARQLGVAAGTLSGRLTTARRLLAARLSRRGLATLATTLPAILTGTAVSAQVPRSLELATVKAATTGTPAAPVTAIMEGVLQSMSLNKLKMAVVLCVALCGIVGLVVRGPASDFAAKGRPVLKAAPAPARLAQAKQQKPGWRESFALTHDRAVNVLACSADWLAVGDEGGNLFLYDSKTGKNRKLLLRGGKTEGLTTSVDRLGFTADGKRLLGITQQHCSIWMLNIENADGPSPGLMGKNPVRAGFAPDGETWLEVYGKILVLRPNVWTRGATVDFERIPFDAEPLHAVLSSDNKWLAVVTADEHLRIHDRATLRETQSIDLGKQTVTALAFSPDGKCLALAGQNALARLYDSETGKELADLKGHGGIVFAVAFSPDSKTVVTGGDDNVARIWEVASGKQVAALEGHKDSVRSVIFHPSGDTLLTGSADKTVKAWKLQR